MRLNKFIAQAGLASRRKADEMIENGRVRINDKVMKEMGYDVKEGDKVEIGGSVIKADKKSVYIMLNKPLGYVTTVADDKERLTVMDLVSDIGERLFPIGRLDYNTSGMLLMTNDGDLAYRLTHPKHMIYKTYKVRVAGVLSSEKASRLARGIDIGGFVTSKSIVTIEKNLERSTLVEIQIYEGKNRQIRKMFAVVGNKVKELQRTAIGELRLGHLKEGHYRKLTPKEIEYLKNS